MSSLHRGGSVVLLYVEEADSFSVQKREMCRLYTKGQSVPLLYIEETMSLFYKGRRETPSRCKGECVSVRDREDYILLLSA